MDDLPSESNPVRRLVVGLRSCVSLKITSCLITRHNLIDKNNGLFSAVYVSVLITPVSCICIVLRSIIQFNLPDHPKCEEVVFVYGR